ncbi:MAG: YciI family protein [Candidatus Sumerlaeaceae bacterium]
METTKAPYMLLFRGGNWTKGLSPEETQRVTAEWMAWFERLKAEGKAKSGHPLEREGKLVSGNGGRVVVADGPFAESKEAIGGYFFLEVVDEAEAVAIAKECPGLPYGALVEVRPVADVCPLSRGEQAPAEAELATAGA